MSSRFFIAVLLLGWLSPVLRALPPPAVRLGGGLCILTEENEKKGYGNANCD